MGALLKAFFFEQHVLYGIKEILARVKMTWLFKMLNTKWGKRKIIDPFFDNVSCLSTTCTVALLRVRHARKSWHLPRLSSISLHSHIPAI